MSRSLRVRSRRHVAALMAAVLVVTGLVVLRAQSVAADTRTTTLTAVCPLLEPVSVAVTATDTPDPAVAGGPLALEVRSSTPDLGVDDLVDTIAFALPMPPQVAAVDAVTFTGGNVTGAATTAVDGSSVALVFTGPLPASAIVLPTITIATTLAAGTGGQTVEWPGPPSITTTFALLAPLTCEAAPTNPPIQSTAVEAAPTSTTTTTTTEPTTTTSSTTTTAPTTTTSSTTTTVPTTTTSSTTTSTSSTTTSSTTTSSTTTTVPTTTTTASTTTTAPTTTTSSTTTTTAPTTTTTEATTTTTAPTTSTSTTAPSTTTTSSTTSSTTTTSRPSTTTTRPRTTTTRPRTTTTRPRTTTTKRHHHGDHDHHHHHHHGRDRFKKLISFLRYLLCRVFDVCSGRR